MKTLMVPHDFSSCSVAALNQAALLSSGLGARLVLLHVRHYEMVPEEQATGEHNFQLMESDRKILDNEVDRIKEAYPGLDLAVEVVFGTPVETIIERANAESVDMIVMGTHARRGLSHLVLGSVAEKVVQLAEQPVVVVKAPAEAQAKVANG